MFVSHDNKIREYRCFVSISFRGQNVGCLWIIWSLYEVWSMVVYKNSSSDLTLFSYEINHGVLFSFGSSHMFAIVSPYLGIQISSRWLWSSSRYRAMQVFPYTDFSSLQCLYPNGLLLFFLFCEWSTLLVLNTVNCFKLCWAFLCVLGASGNCIQSVRVYLPMVCMASVHIWLFDHAMCPCYYCRCCSVHGHRVWQRGANSLTMSP